MVGIVGVGLSAVARAIKKLFSPASLFAAGEQGAWYDPSDFNSYMSVLGPELVTNGDFSNGTTGWTAVGLTASVVSGEAEITRSGVGQRFYQSMSVTSGKSYKISFSSRSGTAQVGVYAGSTDGASDLFPATLVSSGSSSTYSFVARASGASLFLSFYANTSGTGYIDNISVKELTAINNATLFQDAAGTTPVTTVEQPVGLMLDKSKGLVLGSELAPTTSAAWTLSDGYSFSGGALTYIAGTGREAYFSISAVSGKSYLVSYTISSIVSTSVGVYSAQTNVEAVNSYFSTVGTKQAILSANVTGTAVIRFRNSFATGSFVLGNISVRELPGNHAYQSTSANRPVLSARYNLLTKTEQFDDAYWVPTNVVTSSTNAIAAPNGTLTADLVQESNALSNHFLLSGTISYAAGVQYTLSVYVKKGPGDTAPDWVQLTLPGVSFGTTQYANFNISTGQVGTTVGGATASISSVGNGWFRLIYTAMATTTASAGVGAIVFTDNNDGLGRVPSYLGLTTSNVYLWGADLRVTNDGVGIPAYQRVNTSTDYDTTGFPLYIKPNGSSQFMVTNNIVPGTDKAQVFAGVRKLSDVGGMMVELSADSSIAGNAGTFYFYAPPGQYDFASRGAGGLKAATSSSGYSSPITNIVAGLGNISGDSAILRVNGTQAAINTADQGTGNYLTYSLYLFARTGTSLWYGGRFYGMILRFGPTLTAAQISSTETWMNTKTKAYA